MQNVNQDIPIFSNVYLHSRHFLASQLFAQRNTKQTHDERDERHLQHRTRCGRTPLFHRRASDFFFQNKKEGKLKHQHHGRTQMELLSEKFSVFIRSLSLSHAHTHTLPLYLSHAIEWMEDFERNFCAIQETGTVQHRRVRTDYTRD